jgi:Sulfotransferase family
MFGRLTGKFGKRPAGSFARPLLVHYHIYKNAGTSVEKNLSDSYGHRWAVCEGAPEDVLLSNDDIAAFAKANPDVRAISSHKARPLPARRRFFPILFLRHPIDRTRSIYSFARRDPAQPDHTIARDLNFKDYVNWALDTPSVPVRNYQVIHLSQASFRVANSAETVLCPEDLREVHDFLRSLPFFGLVRRFEESCRGFESCYGRTFHALRMRPVRENASTEESLSEAAALNLARNELGEATYRRLADANQFDLALYDAAVELFDRNLARVSERSRRRVGHVVADLFRGAPSGPPKRAQSSSETTRC